MLFFNNIGNRALKLPLCVTIATTLYPSFSASASIFSIVFNNLFSNCFQDSPFGGIISYLFLIESLSSFFETSCQDKFPHVPQFLSVNSGITLCGIFIFSSIIFPIFFVLSLGE